MSLPAQERRGPSPVARLGFAWDDRDVLQEIKREAAFEWLCGQLLPGLASIHVLPGEVGSERDWVRPAIQARVDPRDAVAAHLLAGDMRGAVSLLGYPRERVRAVAFKYSQNARTSRVTIQLSGRVPGYEIAALVARLVARVGPDHLLVTAAAATSGDRREYRCHVRVPERRAIEAVADVAQLLDDCGFARRGGVVDVFPGPQFARLPFGLFESTVLHRSDDGFAFVPECGWRQMVREFQALEPLELERHPTPGGSPEGSGSCALTTSRSPADSSAATPLDPVDFEAYFDMVGRGVARVSLQPADLPWTANGGWEWRVSRAEVRDAVAAHLLASQTGQPWKLGRRAIRAAGLSYQRDAVTSRITVDLDGKHGYEPAGVVAALADLVGRDRLMVTASSGIPGRYHCHARIPPMRVDEAVAASRALLVKSGFAWMSGGAETYPSGSNCRLPFGLGGCELFEDEHLQVGRQSTWQELTRRFCGMPTLVLQPSAPAGGGARRLTARSHAPTYDAEAAAKVERWWRKGVGPHERNDALFALAVDCRRRRLPQADAVREIQRWIDGGGLDQSAVARKPGGIAEQRNQTVLEVVARVYAFPPRAQRRANLSGGEIAHTVNLAKERCGERAAQAVVLLLNVLPWFKGAWLEGRADVTLGQSAWAQTLGRRGSGYALVRRQLHLFRQIAPYVIGERSITWRMTEGFPFEAGQPDECLVSTNPRPAKKQAASNPACPRKASWVLAAAERVARNAARKGDSNPTKK